MKCAYCGSKKTEVFNSRSTRNGTQIWRRRRCQDCGEVMTSYERPDLSAVLYIDTGAKKKARYSRTKLLISLVRAFEQSSKLTDLENIIDTIEQRLMALQTDYVTSAELAEVVLRTIKPVDTAAFVKYLATYGDIASSRELNKLIKKY